MRILLIAGAVFDALLLGVSCSDDDENPVTGSGSIIDANFVESLRR